jgi:hypothetical protein
MPNGTIAKVMLDKGLASFVTTRVVRNSFSTGAQSAGKRSIS